MRRLRPALVVLLVVFYLGAGMWPAWHKVQSAPSGRDYATYHYALAQALDGGDPYDTRALGRRAKAEGTRKSVHPFFYPPPFLLGMLWAAPLSLKAGYQAFFWSNQLMLLGVLAATRRWFKASPLLLALVLATFTPIPDNAKMGQANLPVLLLAVLGLWWSGTGHAVRQFDRYRWSGGVLVGAAAMAKMSPALYLAWWAARRSWRPVLAAMGTAVVLSILALPVVNLDAQIRFYTEVLPGFSAGDYHGLSVPITLPANHSIPDLLNQLWPGPDTHSLDPRAHRAAGVITLALLGLLSAVGQRRRDALGDANIAGAFTVLLLITPVYTYEHHLVFMLVPIIAAGAAVERGRLGRPWAAVLGLAYFFVAWPLYWLRPAQEALPAMAWFFQESKFFGAVVIGAVCVVAALRSPGRLE